MSADAYDEDVSCALMAIAGVLRDRPTSGTGATQRLDPKTEAVPLTPGTSATQRFDLKTEASPVPCDDQALDFEEGDQPDGPADISTMRASADQGRGPSHGLRRGQGPEMKLPKLELRKFSGKPMEWQPFWDTFCSLIDQNDCLTDMDKFTYLRSTLVGGAADVVRLPLVGSNYQAAIACLKERYDDTQRIISAHMDAFLNMAAIMDDHDIAGMRHSYDGVMNHTRSLQALGRSTEQYGDMFVPIDLFRMSAPVRPGARYFMAHRPGPTGRGRARSRLGLIT